MRSLVKNSGVPLFKQLNIIRKSPSAQKSLTSKELKAASYKEIVAHIKSLKPLYKPEAKHLDWPYKLFDKDRRGFDLPDFHGELQSYLAKLKRRLKVDF